MAEKARFFPKNPQKYAGNVNRIVYRSNWERTFMEYCDTRSHVLRWASEELAIKYFLPTDQRWHRYFPDFLMHVQVQPGVVETWLVEIKPAKQTVPPQPTSNKRRALKEALEYSKNQAKWAAAMDYCRGKRWKFVILTEKDLYPNG